MVKLIYKSRCWLVLVLIGLLAACNVRSDMDMERTVMEIEGKFHRGEDSSQDTAIFEARRYYNLSDDAAMKTLSALYSGCVYWQQSHFDSAMAALDEAIVWAKASGDERLIGKVQQTIAELHSDLDRSEEVMKGYLRRRRMLIINSLILVMAAGIVGWLLARAAQKKRKLAEMSLSLEALQKECESLTETHRDNLFQRAMMIYKVFLVGEKKDIDTDTFNKVKTSVCGRDAATAYEAIFKAHNQVYPEMVQRLKNHQPALTDSEFRVGILTMMPFSVKEVADILKLSTAMVGKCRTSIRKKLGINEARGSIEEGIIGDKTPS